MIHSYEARDVFTKEKIPLWLVSAFKAGFLNSLGFLMTGKFVSHVTGFGTQVGIAVGHEDYFFGAELLIIPFSFIFGGVVTSYILDQDYEGDESPPYWKVQGFITILLILIMLLGNFYLNFDAERFDTDERYNLVEFAIIGLLCLVCGLKNGLVTWSTFGRVRVTHLTGLSTDLGLNLLRTFNSKRPAPRFKEEKIINVVRILVILFFSFGAFTSAIIYPKLGFTGLIIPVVISIVMTVVSLRDGMSKKFLNFN